MRTTPKRLIAVMLVVLMVAAAATGGSMAAAPSVDSETSNTSYESEIKTDTELSGFNASEDNESTVVLEGDNSTSPTFEISRNDSDTVVYSNDSMANQTAGSWGTTWNGTLTHDELADLEHTIDENVTVDLVAHDGNESNDTEVQFYINTTDERTVENLDDVDADSDTDDAPVTTESLSDGLTTVTTLDIHTLDFSELDIDDRAVNGDETDVVLVFSNDTVADDAAAAVPDSVADGDPMYRMTLVVSADDGPTQRIRVYSEEAADSVDEDDDTYGVYKDGGIGGEDGIEINLGDEYDDAEEVSVTGTLNDGLTAALMHRALTSSIGSNFDGILGALGGFSDALTGSLPALGLVAARRQQIAG